METNQSFGSLLSSQSLNSDSVPQETSGFGSLLSQKVETKKTFDEPAKAQAPVGDNVKALAAQEGAEHLLPVIGAIYGQESGSGANGRTSTDGARGGMQVMPATFARFAKPGESIDNPDDNMRVGIRIIKSLGDKFGNDPAKIATGYFSGDGNVNPGQGSAWKRDAADGNGKSVSSYVNDVLARIGNASPVSEAKASEPGLPDLSKIPKWGQIASGKKFQSLDATQQQELKAKYFDEVIAPHAKASGANVDQVRRQFMAKTAKPATSTEEPATYSDETNYAYDLYAGRTPAKQSVMEGYQDTRQPTPLQNDASKIPVKPEVRAAFNAQWDKASPEQRAVMAGRQDWVGALAREKGERAQRLDQDLAKTQPQEGEAFRDPVAATSERMLRSTDTRAESREAHLLSLGYDPDTARNVAKAMAAAGVTPGKEDKLTGSVKESDFDFDTKAMFDPNGPTNGLNNPLTRGLAKAALGTGKTLVGFDQFIADMVGADGAANAMRGYGNTIRGKEEAIGEGGTFLERNLEGAVNSIAQQLPLMAIGVKTASEAIPLAGMALQTFGQEYSDGRAKGQSVGEATTRASIFAAFEVIGEKFGIKGNMEAMRAAARGQPTEALVGFLTNMVKKEIPGEMLTTTGQFGTDKLPGGVGLNPGAGMGDFAKQMADTIAQTVMQGLLMGAGGGGVGHAMRYLNEAHMPEDIFARELTANVNSTQWNKQAIDEQVIRSMNPDGTITMQAPGGVTMPQRQAAVAPAEEAGAPAVNPPSGNISTGTENADITDADVTDFAQARLEALEAKAAGQDESENPTGTLTPAEQEELRQLQAAGDDPQKLRTLYGFDQSQENQNAQTQGQGQGTGPARSQSPGDQNGVASGPADLGGNQPGSEAGSSQGSAEAGQRQQGLPAEGSVTESEAEREARLEREAIQSEGQVAETAQPDIPMPGEGQGSTINPFEDNNANQTPEAAVPAVQEEAQQGSPLSEQSVEPWPSIVETGDRLEVTGYRARKFGSDDAQGSKYGTFYAESADGTSGYGGSASEVIQEKISANNVLVAESKRDALESLFGKNSDEVGRWYEAANNSEEDAERVADEMIGPEAAAQGYDAIVYPNDTDLYGNPTRSIHYVGNIKQKPKTEKEAKARREPVDLTEINAQMPPGYEARDDGTSLALYKDGQRTDLHGLSRVNGAPELLRHAKMRAGQESLSKTEQPRQELDKPEVSTNKVFTEEAAAKARALLKSKLGQLNSGLDPEMMQAGITLAGYHIEKGARTFAAYAKAMLADLGDAVRPYLKSWYMGVKYDPRASGFDGMDDAATVEKADVDAVEKASTEPVATAHDLHTPEGKFKVAKQLADEFIGGTSFKTIVEARARIGELIGKKIEPATELAKQADETIETAVVLAAREMIEAGRKQGRSPQVIYDRLVSLYNAQPNLSVRSSTSVRDQAYSTPVPLAYLASELAGITYDTKVLEPTAGNGMLLVGANPANITANELSSYRVAMLHAMGIPASKDNAATATLAPAKSQDAVIANPPFGATKDENGNTIVYEIKPNWGTREVDHAIAFKALEAMKDDGRAVLIVGGTNAQTEEGRREDYRGKNKRQFYFNLYNDYNVVDHFTVDGGLYSKQGASYPVDVIVIQGRGKSSRDLPAADLPKVIESYEALKEKLNGTGSVGTEGVQRPDRTAGGEAATGQGDGAGVAGSPVGQGERTGAEGGRAGSDGSVPVAGRTNDGGTVPSGSKPGTAQPRADAGTGSRTDGKESVPGDSGRAKSGSKGSTATGTDGLGGASTVTGERVESGLTDRRGEEQETENQVAYNPHSNATSVGTLVPKAMRDAIHASLQKLEDQVGNLDDYVAERLEMDPDTIRTSFSAEQVDALALAIKNAEEGRGFIIGDQTGIGKGRVVAAMIRYALVNDKVPIFVTEKPNLYADMIRDLDDIGMTDELGLDTKKPKILMTNSGDPIPYTLLRTVNGEVTESNLTLRSPKSGKALDKLFNDAMAADSLGEFKVIFTTYSQLQTVKGKTTDRMRFVKHFGAGNYMIFDESHNAGGAGPQRSKARSSEQREAEGDAEQTGRAGFVRQLVNGAFGTFFSSATYAKRPDVMDLYSSTNMKLAVDRISQLGEAIKHGGVPMQQVVANMLTTDGQYIRRERTFAGVSYDTVETKVDKQTAENMATAMRRVLAFSRAKEKAVGNIQKEMDKEGAMIREMGGEKSTIQGANFGSIMHNLIDQMLLSLKVQDSLRHAVERLKAGEKVVLTVSNTMGSFIKDYAEEMGLNTGDPVALSFADLYQRYLEKQRWVTIKDGGGNETKRRLTDEELGPQLVKMFNDIQKEIAGFGFGDAPISPIDYMHAELRKAGYKTDEITGRTVGLSYEGKNPKLISRNADIKQRLGAISGFNNGTTDVLILNQSGSTGLSLHANSKFKDQRKRHMIIVQAEKNIDTHMQMLGRVHRTGQVIAPAYSQMMADVPAEMRPAAVLLKKMASLNANTTASRKSSVTAEGVVDFMNDYGGQVAQEYLRDNPDVHAAIGGNKVLPLIEDASEATEEHIRKFTGYIPILPIKQQEEIYKDLIDRYNELLERENTLGTNKLEAKAVDLDAETVSTQQITEDKGDPSIFASPANMERVDVKRTVKPYSSKEVLDMVDERLGEITAAEVASEQMKDLKERAIKFAQERIAKMEKAEEDPLKIEQQKNLLNMIWQNTQAILDTYSIGDSVVLKDKLGMMVYGVITDINAAKRTANPAAGSDWKMHIALANGDAKSLSITFSQLGTKYELAKENSVNWFNPETQEAEWTSLISVFDKGSTARREKRWMVTGNILAGFAKFPGQIITFTKKDGTTGQGVLLSRQFDFEKEKKSQPVNMKTGENAIRFVDEFNGTVGTMDGVLRIMKQRRDFVVVVPSSKKDGGTYYLDNQLTSLLGTDFYKRGQVMSATVWNIENIRQAVDYLVQVRQEPIVALTRQDKAKEMLGEQNGGPQFQDIRRSPSATFNDLPKQRRINLQGKIEKLNKLVEAGKMTDAEFRLAVNELNRDLRDIKDDKKVESMTKGRRRGADWIIAKMRRGVADGTVTRGEAEFAEWLLGQNPHIADRLGISITESDHATARGQYFPLTQVFKLYANNLDEDSGTAVHEILHHAERLLPIEVQEAILSEWQKQWDKAYAKASPQVKAAMRDMLEASFGSQKANDKVAKHFNNGTLTYDEHYQFYSPSEFWTVNATRILSNRYEAKGSWVKQAIQWFKEFIQKLKGLLGLTSDAQVIKALKQVLESNGNPQSAKMIQERDYSAWMEGNEATFEADENAAPQFRNIIGKIQRDATQFFGSQKSLRTFSKYDRSLATQFHKALKDNDYGKVFGYVNAMQNEVSLTSIRPAELAPGILQKVDDFKSAAKTLITGQARNKSLKGATNALLSGTLQGKSVMDGKVWTEDELRNKFGLDDAGVSLYQQARAAVDASLDEVAAAECYAMAQGFIPKNLRRKIIDNPKRANNAIFSAMHKAVKILNVSLENAKKQNASPEKIESIEASIKAYMDTEERIKAVLHKVRALKEAGYMPLMRFGSYTVTAKMVDPETGNLQRGDDGDPITAYFGMFETEKEALEKYRELQEKYAGDPSVSITKGVKSNEGYKLYEGISPETLALFAEEVGADKVMKEYYQAALSERSALKRKLERKNVEGFSQDLPRILANFITSNGRWAAQRYYMRDLINAIKYIPQEKGDVKDEAIKLKEFIMNPNDPAAAVSAMMFAWFLGGSVASAAINLTQPLLMTAPYLSQFGVGTATKAMAKSLPMALGKKQITDENLRKALKRASQEGIVEAQEIFHLYSQGAQGISVQLANALSRIPGVGDKLKHGTDSLRARGESFFTLWGMMFSAAESFNRKLTFLAAWDVAIQNKEPNPYAFAVRAVNETQGIYNKANRPNWARGAVGRTVLTFKQFSIMYVELLSRMAKKGGPEGKKAALLMLAMLMLAAGEEGLPFMQDFDDLIDTLGQALGYDTNMKRNKRRWAHETLGKEWGDLFLYGISSRLPLDFSGRLGLGNLIPGTGLMKSSAEGNKLREVTEVVGPAGSLIQQINDAYEAAMDGNRRKAIENLAPKAVKDWMAATDMATTGSAKDTKGRKNMDVTLADAAIKSVGFNPTKLAEASRARGPIMQDRALQKNTESSIVDLWARGIATKDAEMQKEAAQKLKDWNAKNPNTPVVINPDQIRQAARQYLTDQNTRIIKSAPRESRGRAGLDLAK